jgi:hypothetical protein
MPSAAPIPNPSTVHRRIALFSHRVFSQAINVFSQAINLAAKNLLATAHLFLISRIFILTAITPLLVE